VAGDTFGILIDVDAGSLTFFRNDYPVGMLTGMCALAALYIHVRILLYVAVYVSSSWSSPFFRKTGIRLGMLAGVFALAAIYMFAVYMYMYIYIHIYTYILYIYMYIYIYIFIVTALLDY